MISDNRLKTAIKRYNGIMEMLGYEHKTIGTKLSEDTEDWTLRDMVCECDYILDTYYENGHVNGDLRFSMNAKDRKAWRHDVGFLTRFINSYKPFVFDSKCVSCHYCHF